MIHQVLALPEAAVIELCHGNRLALWHCHIPALKVELAIILWVCSTRQQECKYLGTVGFPYVCMYVCIQEPKGTNCLAFVHRYVYTHDTEAVLYTTLCKGSTIKNTQIHYIIVSGIGTSLLVKTGVTILQVHKWMLD